MRALLQGQHSAGTLETCPPMHLEALIEEPQCQGGCDVPMILRLKMLASFVVAAFHREAVFGANNDNAM
jgi:hypothetical protein